MTTFRDVIDQWDADGATGGRHIHPLEPDSPEFWELGEIQAAQVDDYAAPGDFVIDFGAGIGRLAIPLAARGYNVLAVDASQSMLDGVAARADESGVQLGTLRSDGSDIHTIITHLVGERAAVVVARAVLIHHAYTDVVDMVANLAACLRPGGHLIADWPTAEYPAERSDWIGITTWAPAVRAGVAAAAGLELVHDAGPGAASVWRKTGGET